jgi:ribosomal protein L16 Arg81 hydroxylase
MSLQLLLDPHTVEEFMRAWPPSPQLLKLPDDGHALTSRVSADTIVDILDTGCLPLTDVNVIKNDTVRHPRLLTTNDRLDPAKLRQWRDRGHTVQLRHLERWLPTVATITESIQHETGSTNYVSAFVTPGENQGLQHHWDQYLSLVVQLAGTKTWDLWKPKACDPTRAHSSTGELWQNEWLDEWTSNGPDVSFDLNPHDVLVVPRGWVHNPHNDASAESVHLTFVIKERTPLWIAEHLVAAAINDRRFRYSIPPSGLAPEGLARQVEETRALLISHLNTLNVHDYARILREVVDREKDPDHV